MSVFIFMFFFNSEKRGRHGTLVCRLPISVLPAFSSDYILIFTDQVKLAGIIMLMRLLLGREVRRSIPGLF